MAVRIVTPWKLALTSMIVALPSRSVLPIDRSRTPAWLRPAWKNGKRNIARTAGPLPTWCPTCGNSDVDAGPSTDAKLNGSSPASSRRVVPEMTRHIDPRNCSTTALVARGGDPGTAAAGVARWLGRASKSLPFAGPPAAVHAIRRRVDRRSSRLVQPGREARTSAFSFGKRAGNTRSGWAGFRENYGGKFGHYRKSCLASRIRAKSRVEKYTSHS
ncbi:MAG: hypothetical protein QOC94_539 [Actinoplanes sp.]|jgi:hypothetical protein|nr:hypothetical protein [Actinoplanes sp.]